MLTKTKNKIMIIMSLIIIVGLSIGLPVYFLLIKKRTKTSQNNQENNQPNNYITLNMLTNFDKPQGYMFGDIYESGRTYSTSSPSPYNKSTLTSNTCWSVKVSDMNQWIQLRMEGKWNIGGVALRARGDTHNDQYITSFKVNYIDESGKIIPVDDGKIYNSNLTGDSNQTSYILFTQPIYTDTIIINPQTWNVWISLRADLLIKYP
jgi:hypothetical protein